METTILCLKFGVWAPQARNPKRFGVWGFKVQGLGAFGGLGSKVWGWALLSMPKTAQANLHLLPSHGRRPNPKPSTPNPKP